MTTRQKYWLHFRTAKQPTMQVRVHIEAQTARNFGLMIEKTRGLVEKVTGGDNRSELEEDAHGKC